MWFSLFAAILILAITFYEGLQGLFSGLINCILAILAAALSFALYEDIYFAFLKDHQPDHGRAIVLLGMFIVSLLVLRTFFDAFIKNNLQFPMYVDRAGGGIFGFFTGMIIVGMLSIGFEMLPFGDTFLTYARQQLTDKSDGKPVDMEKLSEKEFSQLQYARQGAWLRQDDFTVALVSHLSNNALRGRQPITDIYPNLLDQVYYYQARMVKDAMPTADPKITIKVDSYWDLRPNEFYAREKVEGKDSKKQYKVVPCKDQPAVGNKRVAVRVTFQDAGKTIEFTAKQVRLVVKNQAENGAVTESTLVGISEEKAGNKCVQAWDGEIFSREVGGKVHYLDFVFEVPDTVQFDPDGSFVEYKQNARAEMSPDKDKAKDKKRPKTQTKEPPKENTGDENTGQSSASPQESGEQRPSGRPNAQKRTDERGRISSIGKAQDAIVSDKLPFVFTEYGGSADIKNGRIVGGRMTAPMTEDWQPVKGSKSPVDGMMVSDDMRLIQVNVEKLHAQSTLGKAREFASDKLADFRLIDGKGGEHAPVGVYAMARISGKPKFELLLLADDIERKGEDTFKKLGYLDTIKRQDLTGEYALYYIFQVKPGTRAVRIDTGKGGQPVDLTEFNIEAK